MKTHCFARPWLMVAIAVMALAAAPPFVHGGPVVYVDDDAAPGGDGAGWATAYRFFQDALSTASGGGVSEIRVAQGTYKPDRDEATPSGSGDRDATFQLISGVALMGGYAGLGAPDPDARDIDLYETILSGDLNGDDLPGFANNDENSYTVVTGSNTDATAVLDGFTITAGNACCTTEVFDPRHLGGGMFNDNGNPTLQDCTFRANVAGNEQEFGWGGGIYNLSSSPTISSCLFVDNWARDAGGGMRNNGNSSPSITSCVFVDNFSDSGAGIAYQDFEGPSNPILLDCLFLNNIATGPGGGIHCEDIASATLVGCLFAGNSGVGAAGALLFLINNANADLEGCVFVDNEAGIAGLGGLGIAGGTATLINCEFIRNSSTFIGGGMLEASNSALINCVFSRNTAGLGGGLYTITDATLINCTFSGNFGNGVMVDDSSNSTLANCIAWGNTPDQIGEDPTSPGGTVSVNYSDIQGGWTGGGSNNIDADPLFVQPGFDNVRLSFGSPCLNVGNNAALPPDEFDLDGDGNTTEPLPVDLDGDPRIIDGIVDMGAYEGEHEPLPPGSSASDQDVDQGETVILIPTAAAFNPLEAAAVVFTNVSGPDNANVTVTQWPSTIHPGAGGYSDLTVTLTIETSLADGEFFATVFVPFNAGDLGGTDPLRPNLTRFDPAVGNWALAVAANTADSPGFPGPIGNRVTVEGNPPFGTTSDLGDYGVFWNPAPQQGLVWANVDHAADFALGAALCPPDCHQTPDGVVGVLDLLALLTAWGDASGNGPCDLNFDGTVDVADLLNLFAAWGPCTQSAQTQWPLRGSAPPAIRSSHATDRHDLAEQRAEAAAFTNSSSRLGDLDGNGRVDKGDLLLLREAWGSNPGHRADLDLDGVVGMTDLLTLLANWG